MITIKEIAKRANTSRGTVDRVVNNRGKVNKELEARIRKIMEEEHYVPNEVARVLTMSGQKINIGVIIGSINHDFLEIVKKGVINESENIVSALTTFSYVRWNCSTKNRHSIILKSLKGSVLTD